MITSSEFSKSIIGLACWRAAPGENHHVALCVCMVFRNRAAAGWFDGDLYENATMWLEENPGPHPDVRDPQFLQLLANLGVVTLGVAQDKTDGALYFTPKTTEKISGTITATMGQMIFFK